jgi:putative endonuclease
MPKLPPSLKQTNYFRGMVAEVYAIIILTLKGYRILAWRYKTPVGEVDIVARRGRTIVFIEVKLRPDTETALYAISPRAQQRIIRAASHFMVSHPRFQDFSMRFDAVAVSGFRLRHLDNAWQSTT